MWCVLVVPDFKTFRGLTHLSLGSQGIQSVNVKVYKLFDNVSDPLSDCYKVNSVGIMTQINFQRKLLKCIVYIIYPFICIIYKKIYIYRELSVHTCIRVCVDSFLKIC